MEGSVRHSRRFGRYAWLAVAGSVVFVLFAGVVFILVSIFTSVDDYGRAAQRDFGGDQVQALMALVDSTSHSLPERNHAVWALGQLRDARALPVLEKHFTGGPCDHARRICQDELKKAIDGCRHRSWSLPDWVARRLRLRT